MLVGEALAISRVGGPVEQLLPRRRARQGRIPCARSRSTSATRHRRLDPALGGGDPRRASRSYADPESPVVVGHAAGSRSSRLRSRRRAPYRPNPSPRSRLTQSPELTTALHGGARHERGPVPRPTSSRSDWATRAANSRTPAATSVPTRSRSSPSATASCCVLNVGTSSRAAAVRCWRPPPRARRSRSST